MTFPSTSSRPSQFFFFFFFVFEPRLLLHLAHFPLFAYITALPILPRLLYSRPVTVSPFSCKLSVENSPTSVYLVVSSLCVCVSVIKRWPSTMARCACVYIRGEPLLSSMCTCQRYTSWLFFLSFCARRINRVNSQHRSFLSLFLAACFE